MGEKEGGGTAQLQTAAAPYLFVIPSIGSAGGEDRFRWEERIR
jgi:hypothetical protein